MSMRKKHKSDKQHGTTTAPTVSASWRNLTRVTRIAFFFSGVSALFYQVIWLRHLATVFGNTTVAMSVTLTAFMSGLAMGSYLCGRWADRVVRPFALYAKLELLIGLYGLVSLALLHLVNVGYIALAHRLPFTSLWLIAFQFAGCFLVLLIPTALMGGTLPVAVKGFVRQIDALPGEVGKLYGINTFGAATGVLMVGFFLLPVLGLQSSVFLAALINLGVGVIVWRRDAAAAQSDSAPQTTEKPKHKADRDTENSQPALSKAMLSLLVLSFALSGFAGLALEVVWARAFCVYIGSSVYCFSAVLLTILIGIALGGLIIAGLARHRQITLDWFAGAQLGAGFSVLVLGFVYNSLAFVFLRLVDNASQSFFLLLFMEILVIMICLIVPTLLGGATFPIVSRMFVRTEGALARQIGFLYAANTVGCILGSFAAGFILIRFLGLRASVLLCAALYIVGGAAVLLLAGQGRRRPVAVASLAVLVAVVFLLPKWDSNLMSAGIFMHRAPTKAVLDYAKKIKLIFYREGELANVSVYDLADKKRSLAVNGKVDASDDPGDMDTQRMIAHFPMLIAKRTDSVFIVGYGSGTTAATVGLYPVKKIDCVEIEPAVIEAERYFHHINKNIMKDPRFHLTIADARNYLAASPQQYDVIISEPSNPWLAGVASLFTVENFQALRNRLANDGIICQWLQLYSMSDRDIASVVASFTEVFPDASLWVLSRYNTDVALIAQKRPWKVDLPRLIQRAGNYPRVKTDLQQTIFNSPISLISGLLLGPDDLKKLAGAGQINTDNNPTLEFSAPLGLYTDISKSNSLQVFASCKSQSLQDLVDFGSLAADPNTNMALAEALAVHYPDQMRVMFGQTWMREEIAAALTIRPPTAALLERAATLALVMNDIPTARKYLQNALQLEPNRKSVQETLKQIDQ
jgi:spermidine synthase